MKIIPLLFSIFFIFYQTSAQQIKIYPEKPEMGENIKIEYNGPLANEEGTRLEVYFFNQYFSLFAFQKENGKLITNISLPDSVVYITIKVINNQRPFESEVEGFSIFENGKKAKGSRIGEADFGVWESTQPDYHKSLGLIKEELDLNPDLKYLSRLYTVDFMYLIPEKRDEALQLAQKYYDEILKTGEYNVQAWTYCRYLSGNDLNKYDSLTKAITNKFPQSILEWAIRYNKINALVDLKPEKSLNDFILLRQDYLKLSKNREELMWGLLLDCFLYKKDYVYLKSALDKIKDSESFSGYGFFLNRLTQAAENIIEDGGNIDLAKDYVLEVIHKLEERGDTASENYGKALQTYAKILSLEGKSKEALAFHQKAKYLISPYDVAEHKINMVKYLIEDKQYKSGLNLAEEILLEQKGENPRLDSLYKEAYTGFHGSDKGYSEAYNSFKTNSEQNYIENIKTKLTNVNAPQFTLNDLDGNKVNLSDYRGKIVVLDFWATWCGPCIRSFPAMKELQNEWKDVVFLFINSLEDGEIEKKSEKIRKVLKSKDVEDFKVLLDYKEDSRFKVAQTDHGISAIPAKLIIDKEGNLRYKSTGFSSKEDLQRELKTVFELIE